MPPGLTSRSRCAPGSAASTCARACCCAAPAGWGEFTPFLDYDDAECVPWLARRAGGGGRRLARPGARRRSRSTSPSPRSARSRRRRSCARSAAAATAKVKVAEPGQAAGRRPGPGRGGARRARAGRRGSGSTPTAAGTSTTRSRADPAARPGRRRAGVRRAAVRAPSRSSPRVRRRVDVPIAADESIRRAEDPLRVAATSRPPTSRCSRCSRSAGSRACLRIAEEIGLPVVVSSALETSVGIAAGRRAGGRAARAALRLRAGDAAAARPAT